MNAHTVPINYTSTIHVFNTSSFKRAFNEILIFIGEHQGLERSPPNKQSRRRLYH